MPFDILFQGKKDAILRNTVNNNRVINVILSEFKKPDCNASHSYDDADIDINKVKCSKFLEMSYK